MIKKYEGQREYKDKDGNVYIPELVNGQLDVRVWATCPHCNEYDDITGQTAFDISDSIPTEGLDMEIECSFCDMVYILDGME